jgi:hypothetical protein
MEEHSRPGDSGEQEGEGELAIADVGHGATVAACGRGP